jgi:hypothetical protein
MIVVERGKRKREVRRKNQLRFVFSFQPDRFIFDLMNSTCAGFFGFGGPNPTPDTPRRPTNQWSVVSFFVMAKNKGSVLLGW